MKERFKGLLLRILLLPVMPCFMWGPFTHPYVSMKALEKAKRDPDSVGCKDILESVRGNEDIFMYASNAPDAISTFHILKNMMVYDYAHTYLPDSSDGNPTFGYRILDVALARLEGAPSEGLKKKHRREIAFACGWLSHQLADRVPHYQETPSPYTDASGAYPKFHGYSNSHQILTSCFYEDILQAKRNIEHGIIELFHDAYVIINDSSHYFSPGKNHVELLIKYDSNLISEVSATFLSELRCRIDCRHLPSLERDFNVIIKGQECLIRALRILQPTFDELVTTFIGERQTYIEQSIEDVLQGTFGVSRDKIRQLASNSCPTRARQSTDISVVTPKKESILQKLAFQIGSHADAATIETYLRKAPVIRFNLSWIIRFSCRTHW